MSKYDEIVGLWESANAFLVNGMVCGDFTFPEEVDEDEEDAYYIGKSFSFYITTSDYRNLEFDFDKEEVLSAIVGDNNELRFTSQDLTIQPLFTQSNK